MHRHYTFNVLRELRDQQVRYAPREKKIEQSYRAEKLLRDIHKEKQYSYRFVCVGITEFRAEMYPELMFKGEDLRQDLIKLIEDLFDSANVSTEEVDQRVWSIKELSEQFKVSEKTISRWRKQGLISRRFLFGKKKRVGFLQDSVDYFMQTESSRIERGESFSQLTSEEKRLIIQAARRFFDPTISPTKIVKRIARYMGRSVETIRYTLKTFDEQNSDIPVFPNRHTPLDDSVKSRIFVEFRRGVSIEKLATAYQRSRGSIYRIIGQMRAGRIAGFALDYIDNPEFHTMTPAREKKILGPMPQTEPVTNKTEFDARKEKPTFVEIMEDDEFSEQEPSEATDTDNDETSGLPIYLTSLYKTPLLNAEQELHLFRKMNYLKFKASKLRDSHDANHPKNHLMGRIEELYDMAVATKNEIVSANLRLVVSIAKRHVSPYAGFFDLVSDGNLSLLRAVEKFDYGRGNRFSTYATWAITRNFARTIPDEKKHRDRFHQGEEDFLGKTIDLRSDLQQMEQNQFEREQQVDRLLGELNEREQKIIISRFGIGRSQPPLTLNEVGVEMGVTKERVRQIEARALAKLKKVAEEADLEIPGL